ncbi:hypothetical protein FRC01_010085, partial [Tulasnella sp. 417]
MPRANLDYGLLESILVDLNHLSIHPNRLVPVECSPVTGGYGTVTVAKLPGVMDPTTRSDFLVAVKTLRPVGNSHERSLIAFSLVRELKVWQSLEHPNILYLFGFYLNNDKTEALLISPYLKFGHIEEYIQDENPNPVMCVDLIFFKKIPFATCLTEPGIYIQISKGRSPADIATLTSEPFGRLRDLLAQCWQLAPQDRPSALNLLYNLRQFSGQLAAEGWSSGAPSPSLSSASTPRLNAYQSLSSPLIAPNPNPGFSRGLLTFTQFDALQRPKECQVRTIVQCSTTNVQFLAPWPTALNIRPVNYRPIPETGVSSLFPSVDGPVFTIDVDIQYGQYDPYDTIAETGPIHFSELWETLAKNGIYAVSYLEIQGQRYASAFMVYP